MNKKCNHIVPPKWVSTLLRRVCKPDLLEEIEGDLLEYYELWVEKYGASKANRLYVWHAVKFLRPFAIKKTKSQNSNHTAMFKNNLKIAWRGLLKQKIFSAIKIGGFSLGITACFLISLFILDELSYDQHYKDKDRIYRLVNFYNEPGGPQKGVSLPAPIKSVLDSDFPEIEKSARLIIFEWFDNGDNQFRLVNNVENSYEEGFIYADPEILEILEIPMVYGEHSEALSLPNSIVISKKKSEKYFPGRNPIGETIILNENEANPFIIGGVMEDFPPNSHLNYDFLITLKNKEFWPGSQTEWWVNVYDVYVKLKEGADASNLEKKLLSIKENHIVATMEAAENQYAEYVKKYYSFELQPVEDIYLETEVRDFSSHHGDIKIVWLFGSIAGFILILACINFINLSTAKSANRAKEVGLRKVIGSYRSNLVSQFMTESLVYSLISFAIAILLACTLLPYFNVLADKNLDFPWSEWWLIPGVIGSIIIVGILAGCYPALYLSGFKPIAVLKGNLSMGSKSSTMRGGLVVFQFATSIVLIICTFITYQQMDFILNKKIGYDKDQVLLIHGANTLREKRHTFKNELVHMAEVKNVTQTDYLPVSGTRRDGRQAWKAGRSKIDLGIGCQYWQVDEDYINTLGMKLVEGRGFSTEIGSDSLAVIINQTMARQLNLENPVGERIIVSHMTYNIIGVVEDFHFESMKGNIEPISFILSTNAGSILSVKIETGNMAESMATISALWSQYMPNQPIRYTFLDDSYARMYADVERTGKVFTIFAGLAIVVACLGLFALSAFMVEQRSKEISVRKVLGASIGSIFNLLTINFLKLVLIALVIAVPIGWYMMKEWLEGYSYRISMTWEVYATAGVLAIFMALLTISSESIRAALSNPADNLRSE